MLINGSGKEIIRPEQQRVFYRTGQLLHGYQFRDDIPFAAALSGKYAWRQQVSDRSY